jgi:hypothetical protein
MKTIERHKRAISYGEMPPSFERPMVTSNRLPDEHLSDEELFDAFFEADLRKVFVPRGLVR